MLTDLRYGLRLLRKNPGFTAFALLALAIGIGANVTVFSVVNQVLLKPPGYRDPNRLVLLQSVNPQQETLEGYGSWDDFQDLRKQAKTLDTISAVSPRWNFTLQGRGGAESVYGQWVTASLFNLLGVNPLLGRSFTEDEDRPGAIRAVVLSYEVWQRAFGASQSVIGTQLRIDQNTATVVSTATVVGVMPPGFRFLDDADLWVPLAPNPINERGRGVRYLRLAARVAPSVSIQQCRAELAAIVLGLASKFPNTNTGFSGRLTLLPDFLTADSRPLLLMLAVAVALVLLIACANVANLVLTRTLARKQELAVRIALGAGRLRLVRQLLAESLLLATFGGAIGLLLATWGTFAIRLVKWKGVSGLGAVEIDPRVLLFTVLASVFSALLVGMLPALRLSESGWAMDLRGEGRSATTTASGQRMRSALLIGEIALTTVLLSGCGLLVRSLAHLLEVDPGFEARNLLTFHVNLPADKYSEALQRKSFYDRLSAGIRSLPGVRAVGAVSRLPLDEGNITTAFTIEGRPIPEGQLPSIDYRIASDSYFPAMGIALLQGRLADPRNANEVNINQTAARRFWPEQSPIGRRVKFGLGAAKDPWRTVVGVVGDVHHFGLEIAPRPEVYRPYIANPLGGAIFAVRAAGDSQTLAAAIRERLRVIDPEVPMFNIATMEQLLAQSLQARRLSVLLLTGFAGIALLLAAIGLYGVVSFAVGLRTHEIGIRVALGAEGGSVVRMMLAQGLRIVVMGLAIGLAGALAIGPLLAQLTYQTSSRDPIALLAASGAMIIVALLACYFPARRAADLDPMAALRS
jgi:putative ABC transport system permease protein